MSVSFQSKAVAYQGLKTTHSRRSPSEKQAAGGHSNLDLDISPVTAISIRAGLPDMPTLFFLLYRNIQIRFGRLQSYRTGHEHMAAVTPDDGPKKAKTTSSQKTK